MAVLSLLAKQDYLEKIAATREPHRALAEFVWNAVDAEATEVSVDFVLNALEGIEAIRITDNGHGISEERAAKDFRNLGDSWKRSAHRTRNSQRALHGKEGRGRLRFFSIAHEASWLSTFEKEGELQTLSLNIKAGALDQCALSDAVAAEAEQTGTIVELSGLKETFDWLRGEEAFREFNVLFAAYVLQYPDVKISYGGKLVDPSATIARAFDFALQPLVCPSRTISDLSLKVIEWNSTIESRKIHFGGESGVVLGSQSANVTAPDFEFSAYAYSSFFQELAQKNLLELDELNDPDFSRVLEYIRDQLSDYFRARQAERSSSLIDDLKRTGAYPYEGVPKNDLEHRERQVFDIATYAVSSYSKDFKRADASLKRMTLTLLRESLRHNPDSLSNILRAVVNLPKNRQDEFSSLLEKTELGHIITASSMIADRIMSLEMLKGMVFDPRHKLTIKERGELDVLVRDNTWIFGENFHITLPEAGLSKVMERVSQELSTKRSKGKIRKPDGKIGRVDAFLGRSVPLPDRLQREFLLVELKRPSLKVGRHELDQLEDYTSALKAQPDYSHTNTYWNFYLVSGEIDPSIKDRVSQKDRPPGLYLETENSKVWVKTWAELIRDCESRMSFVQEKLNIVVAAEDIETRILQLRASILRETSEKPEGREAPPSGSRTKNSSQATLSL